MTYKLGDWINTTKGYLWVQCPIKFKDNNNPKYDKLGGRTLFWLQDEQYQDIFLWDTELNKIIVKDDEEGEIYEETDSSF